MTAHPPGRQPGSDLAPAIPSEPDGGSSRDEGVLMAIHLKMPAEEAADRLAIRELFDAYTHCAGNEKFVRSVYQIACDVFELSDGKIKRFDCYPSESVILIQLGVLGNLDPALQH
jgi:hypothetical protein